MHITWFIICHSGLASVHLFRILYIGIKPDFWFKPGSLQFVSTLCRGRSARYKCTVLELQKVQCRVFSLCRTAYYRAMVYRITQHFLVTAAVHKPHSSAPIIITFVIRRPSISWQQRSGFKYMFSAVPLLFWAGTYSLPSKLWLTSAEGMCVRFYVL